jgi:hypothetical protein
LLICRLRNLRIVPLTAAGPTVTVEGEECMRRFAGEELQFLT